MSIGGSCVMDRPTPDDPLLPPPGRNTHAMNTKSASRGTAKKKTATRHRLSSVATAVRLLQAFSEQEAEIGVSELAKRLKVSKSTVHRLAVTLVEANLLEQNPETERYRLGIGLFGLGTLVRQRMNLSNEARPYLFELRTVTNETILLGIASGLDVMHVYDLESLQALAIKSDLGSRRPGYCTAIGRAIFAFAPDETIDALLEGPLPARTPQTVTDPARLREILAEVRRRGFAVEDGEYELGVRAIAAPVRDASGAVVGAVGIAGPSQRLSREAMRQFAVPLLEVVKSISTRLGYAPRHA